MTQPKFVRLELRTVLLDNPPTSFFDEVRARFPEAQIYEDGIDLELALESDISSAIAWLSAASFDFMVLVDDCGFRHLRMRLPQSTLPLEIAKLFEDGEWLGILPRGDELVIQMIVEFADPMILDFRWAPRLAPILRHLDKRDLRPLSLMWLSSACYSCDEWDVPEPPVPPGLKDPPACIANLAAFLDLPIAILERHAEASPPLPAQCRPQSASNLDYLDGLLSKDLESELCAQFNEGADPRWLMNMVCNPDYQLGLPSSTLPLPSLDFGPRDVAELFADTDPLEMVSPLTLLKESSENGLLLPIVELVSQITAQAGHEHADPNSEGRDERANDEDSAEREAMGLRPTEEDPTGPSRALLNDESRSLTHTDDDEESDSSRRPAIDLRLTILGLEPAISRTVRMPLKARAEDLSKVLSAAFAWKPSPQWHISASEGPSPISFPISSSETLSGLRDLEMTIQVSFRDEWKLLVEFGERSELGLFDRPRLIAGARAAPTEGMRGIPGYNRACDQVYAGPVESASLRRKLGLTDRSWHPDSFDLSKAQRDFEGAL